MILTKILDTLLIDMVNSSKRLVDQLVLRERPYITLEILMQLEDGRLLETLKWYQMRLVIVQ